MFAQLKIYKNMIFAGVVLVLLAGLYFYIHSLKTQINDLKVEIQATQVKLANSQLEATRYKSALDKQNIMIENLKVSKNNALNELEKWKAKKPEVKYKVIEKIRKVKSNECKDIKNTLDDIRHLDFHSL